MEYATSVNGAQLDVLIATNEGPKLTSNVTRGDYVSGISAIALEKAGLVKLKTIKTGDDAGRTRVTITPAGRRELKGNKRPVLA